MTDDALPFQAHSIKAMASRVRDTADGTTHDLKSFDGTHCF